MKQRIHLFVCRVRFSWRYDSCDIWADFFLLVLGLFCFVRFCLIFITKFSRFRIPYLVGDRSIIGGMFERWIRKKGVWMYGLLSLKFCLCLKSCESHVWFWVLPLQRYRSQNREKKEERLFECLLLGFVWKLCLLTFSLLWTRSVESYLSLLTRAPIGSWA